MLLYLRSLMGAVCSLSYILLYADLQRYEAASTIYGPYTLNAYQQEFSSLTSLLASNQPNTVPGPTPPDLSSHTVKLNLLISSLCAHCRFRCILTWTYGFAT